MRLNGRLVRTYATALLIAFSLAAPAAARPGRSAETRSTVNISTIQIKNFGRVNPSYYRGAQPRGRDYADLAALGVRTLINLTSDDAAADEKAMVERAGMGYFQIPMTTHEPPTPAKLAEFLRIVNNAASLPVYVHCVGGRHRTGVMTAVYRITKDGWTADQAFKEMKRYKFGPSFLHPEFKDFVYSYGAQLARATPSHVGVATRAGS